MSHHSRILASLLLVLSFFKHYCDASDDVLGCGGFVRSDVEINFAFVEVKLYTPHGSIKYTTDCAPNTGYYLIPLYEKGDFVIKVEPPAGWTFEPESFPLHIDGEKDPCSLGEDINFVFTGFSLNGLVVSKGQKTGPQSVPVSLLKTGTSEVLQSVQTNSQGGYQFKKILPGKYTVTVPKGPFRFEKSETSVEVIQDNADAGSSLVISGYTVTGQVFSEGEPIKGVNFLLYSSTVAQKDVQDCDKSPIPGMGKKENYDPLCHVTSDVNGKFTFPCLVTGEYYLVPFYRGEHITFDVEPEKLDFKVAHSPYALEKAFQVAGFSVSGQVLDSEKGSGIAGAQILLNDEPTTKTGPDGTYHLENMKTGVYRIQARADNLGFNVLEVKITPNTPQLPSVVASSFNLCGRVSIEKYPEGFSPQSTKRKVIIFPEGKGSAAVSKEANDDGRFCHPVTPGKYIVRVHITDAEAKAGLTISPPEHTITVTNKPILDIAFSQFRAKVTGIVTCMEKCVPMEVSLDSLVRNDKLIAQTQNSAKGATFSFDNVLPGKYKATILKDNLCWKAKTVEFEVANENLDSLQFQQTGYILKCTLSHSITLNFAHENKEGSVGSFELKEGKNRFCLAQPGVYKLSPDSCHKFEKEVYTYDTANPETLTLTAVSHLVKGTMTAQEPAGDAVVTIVSSLDQTVTTLGPLSPEGSGAGNATKTAKGPLSYPFSHWTRSGEKLTVSIKSSEMLYTPSSMEVTITGDSCPGEMIKFTGERGQFIVGQVRPALAGVMVTVTDPAGKMEPVTMETNDKGDFRVGPLHKQMDYQVTAAKTGYVFEKKEGEMAVFKAFKLGKISVKLMDESDTPLPDTLLSLSGGRQYRSNNLTKEDGTMLFVDLSPGQYFLRPMMKEYKFEPASQMIDVLEGTTMDITIRAVRTAYSCYGQVTSLNGEPEPGVFVVAKGQGSCEGNQEEAKTELNGNYRIRGLQPKCTYEIRLQIGEMNKHIERAAPKTRQIKVDGADITGVNIIAFRRMNQMDISGNVITDPQYLPGLKVRLYKEDNPGVPMVTVPLGVVSFFYLPSLQMDDMLYRVTLESSISKNTHEFIQPEVEIRANLSYKHITFKFEPKRKSLEQELSQSSILVLPLTILIVLAGYNYQKLLPLGQNLLNQVQTGLQKRPAMVAQQQPIHIQEFDLQDSPISKKKNKPRKT